MSTFSTLVPGNQTAVRLTTTGNADLVEGGTYGIETVVVARFDEPIPDRAAAQRALRVTTNPPVEGAGPGSTTRPRIGGPSTTTPRAPPSRSRPTSTASPSVRASTDKPTPA